MRRSSSLFLAILLTLIKPLYAANVITEETLRSGIISTIIYGLLGIVMATLAYKVVDKLTPGNLSKDIAESKNLPLALLASSMILGICIIIAAAICG